MTEDLMHDIIVIYERFTNTWFTEEDLYNELKSALKHVDDIQDLLHKLSKLELLDKRKNKYRLNINLNAFNNLKELYQATVDLKRAMKRYYKAKKTFKI